MKLKLWMFVLAVMLTSSVSAQQIQQETSDYLGGQYKRFVCDGTGKGLGLKFSLRYPAQWIDKEGNRPHIVRKFISPAGGVSVLCIVTSIKDKGTKKDYDNYLATTNDFSGFTEGGTFLGVRRGFKIDGEPAGELEYSQSQATSTGMSVYVHGYTYYVNYGTNAMQIMCSVGGTEDSKAAIDQKFESYKFLFRAIASSLVINSKWE